MIVPSYSSQSPASFDKSDKTFRVGVRMIKIVIPLDSRTQNFVFTSAMLHSRKKDYFANNNNDNNNNNHNKNNKKNNNNDNNNNNNNNNALKLL